MMSGDLDWTAALGEAVVADQAAVLEAVQAFRRKTQSAGNLKSDREADGGGREGSDHDRADRSAGDLRAAVQPDHGGGQRLCRLGLLPVALPGVLLPLRARRRLRHRPDLGRGDGRDLERRPLRQPLPRRRHQHRPQHQHQPRHEHQHRRQSRQPRAEQRRRREVELGQAEGPGQPVGGRQPAVVAGGRRARRPQRLHGRGRRRRLARRRRPERRNDGPGRRRWRPSAAARRTRRRRIARRRGQRRHDGPRRRGRRRRLRRLRLGSQHADGQLARRLQPRRLALGIEPWRLDGRRRAAAAAAAADAVAEPAP